MEVLQRLLKALGSKAVQAEEARPTVTADLLSQQAPSKEEQEFLDIAGDAYGYLDASKKRRIDGIRQREFSRLEAPRPGAEGIAYLDWGGAALFSEQQLEAAHDELRSTLLCNPHSVGGPAAAAGEHDAELRALTLAMCNVDSSQYQVILTSGATAGLKLLTESLPWGAGSQLVYMLNSHNSVLGMREAVLQAGGSVQAVDLVQPPSPSAVAQPVSTSNSTLAAGLVPSGPVMCRSPAGGNSHDQHPTQQQDSSSSSSSSSSTCSREGNSLRVFAMPHECNFSGQRLDLALVTSVQAHGPVRSELSASSPQVGCQQQQGHPGHSQSQHPHPPPVPQLHHPHSQQQPLEHSHLQGQMPAEGQQAQQGHLQVLKQGQKQCAGDVHQQDQQQGSQQWLVVLDAAKSCATRPPDLSKYPADFVVLSYYKIFGYPTGLGALLVRRSSAHWLCSKAYWGGGTVAMSVADRDLMARRPGPAGLEDGTLPFTSISAARHGFAFISRLGGFPAVAAHAGVLADYLHRELAGLRHSNSAPVAAVYGRQAPAGTTHSTKQNEHNGWNHSQQQQQQQQQHVDGSSTQSRSIAWDAVCSTTTCNGGHQSSSSSVSYLDGWGPTVTFNLRRPDGSWVGYHEVSRLAALHGIQLRTGCFCNPGACAKYLGLTAEEVRDNYEAGHVCWDDHDVLRGKPTGAVRASLGAASSFKDVHALLTLIRRYFVDYTDDKAWHPAHLQLSNGVASNNSSNITDPASPAPAVHVSGAATAAVSLQHPPSVADPAMTASGQVVVPESESPHGVVAASTSYSDPGSSALSTSQLGDQEPEASEQSLRAAVAAATSPQLVALFLYPIKSCAPQQAQAWPVGPNGLLYDREWALVDDEGAVVTQKRCPRAALIRPVVDLAAGTLTIHAPPPQLPSPASSAAVQGPGLPTLSSTAATTAAAAPGGLLLSPLVFAIPGLQKRCMVQQLGASSLQRDGHQQQQSQQEQQGNQQAKPDARAERQRDGSVQRIRVCGDDVCSIVVEAVEVGGDVSSTTTLQAPLCSTPQHGALHSQARVRDWFRAAVGVPCCLVQQSSGARKARQGTAGLGPSSSSSSSEEAVKASAAVPAASQAPHKGGQKAGVIRTAADAQAPASPASAAASPSGRQNATVGFANDGQYLVVNAASVADVNARLLASSSGASPAAPVELLRFRPNLVVAGLPAYHEDTWSAVKVGALQAEVLGTCPRCEMLQVDQKSGTRGRPDVLRALAQYRRYNGRMHFGILLVSTQQQPSGGWEEEDSGHQTQPALSSEFHDQAAVPAAAGSVNSSHSHHLEWLRRRFGAVLCVGDTVLPTCVNRPSAP